MVERTQLDGQRQFSDPTVEAPASPKSANPVPSSYAGYQVLASQSELTHSCEQKESVPESGQHWELRLTKPFQAQTSFGESLLVVRY